MGRRRQTASLVLGAFSAALTVLPWLHTLHHRDDHVHVDGAIVFVGGHGHDGDGDEDHDHHHVGEHEHEHEHEHVDEHEDEDEGAPGFDHPGGHGPHGRGALAHGSAFILAGTVFLFPAPAALLERLPPAPCPEAPALALLRSPRETRGPPAAARS
jgi:hypothetical protein